MTEQNGTSVVVGRLRSAPVAVFLGTALALTAGSVWELVLGDRFRASMYYHVFGELLGPLVAIMGLVATYSFSRMWKARATYLRFDEGHLYRGSTVWPKSSISGVEITQNAFGLRSLRIMPSKLELAKTYMLVEDPGQVRDALERWLASSRSGR